MPIIGDTRGPISALFSVVAGTAPALPVSDIPAGYEVIIRSAAGARRAVFPSMIGAASWTIQRLGGYDDFALPLACKTTEMLHLQAGDRVDIWFGGQHQYRGWINERTRQVAEPSMLLLKGYGRLFDLGKKSCDRLIVRPAGIDIRDLFDTITQRYVLPLFSGIIVELPAAPTGYTLTRLDTRGKTIAAVMGELIEATANTYVWGWDIDGAGADRLYLRAVGATRDGINGVANGRRVIGVPGPEVTATSGQRTANDIVNRLLLTGGDLDHPNLVPNASFESPVEPDGTASNLLYNSGFEEAAGSAVNVTDLAVYVETSDRVWATSASYNFLPSDVGKTVLISGGTGWTTGRYRIVGAAGIGISPHYAILDRKAALTGATGGIAQIGGVDAWVLGGTATIVTTSPHSGTNAAQTDSSGEYFEQERILPTGILLEDHHYQVKFYARPVSSGSGSGEVTLWWHTSSGWAVHGPYTVSADIVGYEQYPRPGSVNDGMGGHDQLPVSFTPPAGCDGFRIRLEHTTPGSGLVWDDVSFFDLDEPTQTGWAVTSDGGAAAAANWDDDAAAKHGAFGVTVTVTYADGGAGSYATLAPTDKIAGIVAGAVYLLSAWFTAGSRAGETDTPDGEMILTWYKADGSPSATQPDPFTIGAAGSMTVATIVASAPVDAVSCSIALRMTEPGLYSFDALTLMDLRGLDTTGGVIPPGQAPVPYQPDGPLSMLLKAEDLVTTGEDSDVHDSFATWKWREASETVEDVKTIAQAVRFAKPYFLTRAKEQYQPTVTLAGVRWSLWTSDTMRLEGADGPALGGSQDLPITRIRGTVDGAGILQRVSETGREQPTIAGLIRQAAKDAKNRR